MKVPVSYAVVASASSHIDNPRKIRLELLIIGRMASGVLWILAKRIEQSQSAFVYIV